MSSVFRQSGPILAVLALALVALPAVAEPRNYSPEIAKVGVLARLDGKPVTAAEFESPYNPFLGVVRGDEVSTLIMHRALNSFRVRALNTLAPKLLGDCATEPTPADINSFYGYWRMTAATELARMKTLGREDTVGPPAPSIPGLTILPNTPFKELALVGPQLPGADALAGDAVRQWKTYHCVQATYGGDGFFTINVDRQGRNWPLAPLLTGEALNGKNVRLPDTGDLEPVTALGRFFRDAERRGLLAFDNPAHRAYFFDRYEGGGYDAMKEPARAKRYLERAPWNSPDDAVVVTGYAERTPAS